MSQTSRPTSGHCSANHFLRITLISVFYFFVWAWPALSNPLPCKDYFDGKAVYLLDRDNHLVPHFVDTGCRLLRRQDSHRSDTNTAKNEIIKLNTEGSKVSGDDDDDEGDKPLLIERAGHSTTERIKGTGREEDKAILGIVNHHLVRSEHIDRINARDEVENWREEVNAFHKDYLGKAWERARESLRQAEIQSASETPVPTIVSLSAPYRNHTGHHSYSAVPSPSVIMEKSPAMVTQGVDSELQEDTMRSYVESDDDLGLVPPIAITTSQDTAEEAEDVFDFDGFSDFEESYHPEEFSDSEEFYYSEEFPDFEELFEPGAEFIGSEEEFLGSREGLFEPGEGLSDSGDQFIGSGELFGPGELFESQEWFDSKELPALEESTGTFSGEAIALSEIPASLRISHYRPSRNSGKVLANAVGLGLLMAIPSLIIMCALSRKGQYIWIRTVNLNDLVLPTSEHARYEGGSRASANLSAVTSRDGSESAVVISRRNISGADGSDILDRQDIGPSTMSETVSNLESSERSDIRSRHGMEGTNRSGPVSRHDIESENRSGLASRQGMERAGLLAPIGPVPVRKLGVFQRWFGWGAEDHDNLAIEETPPRTSSTRQSSKIHSSRTISRDRTPDPNLVTQVCERLIRERMSQLSTIPSAGEEEGSGTQEARELPSKSFTRAPVTGDTSETQGSAPKRNPQGILKAPANSHRPDVSGECPVAHGNGSTREENQVGEEGSEGSSSKGKNSRLVRFDGTADKVEPRNYLHPTVEDDEFSAEEALDSSTLEMSDGTVIRKGRKGERIGGMWGGVFSDPMAASITNSLGPGEMGGAALERQPKRDGEYVNSSRGTSISGDSTLTGNSNDEVVIVDSQLPMEEGHRLTIESPVNTPSINAGAKREVLLSPLIRTQASVSIAIEGIDNNETVVSAFGMRAESPMWDSQTSNDGSGSLLSSGFFTETNTSSERDSIEDENLIL